MGWLFRDRPAPDENEAATLGTLARIDQNFRASPLSSHPWLEESCDQGSRLSRIVYRVGLALLFATSVAAVGAMIGKARAINDETFRQIDDGRLKG